MSAHPTLVTASSVDVACPAKDEAFEVGASEVIYIDTGKEKAAFRKFDKYVVPTSFVFMLLCALDRNNVSETYFSPIVQC